MGRPTFPALILGAALGVAAMPACAVSCFEVLDRNQAVIYRDTHSPVDLSDAGAQAREAMRKRGETLIFFDADSCIVLGTITASGARSLSVDEIVAGYKGFAGRNNAWNSYRSTWTGSSSGAGGSR